MFNQHNTLIGSLTVLGLSPWRVVAQVRSCLISPEKSVRYPIATSSCFISHPDTPFSCVTPVVHLYIGTIARTRTTVTTSELPHLPSEIAPRFILATALTSSVTGPREGVYQAISNLQIYVYTSALMYRSISSIYSDDPRLKSSLHLSSPVDLRSG
jgi:hypothetical protein